MDHPRGTSRGWKTKPPQLQGLSQRMSQQGSVHAALLRSGFPGGKGDVEAGPSWREAVRAAVVPQESPRGTHWIHPGWGSAPSTRKAMLGVKSVTNRSCSEVRSEPSLPEDQREDKVLTNQGKSPNPVPAGATSVPELPPSTCRPRGVRQHWGDALPSREGKEKWGWGSTGTPRSRSRLEQQFQELTQLMELTQLSGFILLQSQLRGCLQGWGAPPQSLCTTMQTLGNETFGITV